jgi:hypothetical protein
MEAKERGSATNSQRSRMSQLPSNRTINDPMHHAVNPKVLGDKLRIAKLRLPEADPDSMMN